MWRLEDSRGSGLEQLRGSDPVAGGDFEDDSDRGGSPRRQTGVGNGNGKEKRDGDCDRARQPLHDGAELNGAIGPRDERWEEVDQKKDRGVQEGQHAKPSRRLPNQIARQPLRIRSCRLCAVCFVGTEKRCAASPRVHSR